MKDETAASLRALMAAADGLLMPSESDYPFEPFCWKGVGELTPEALLVALGLPPDTPVEQRTLERQFAPLVRAWDGMDAAERAQRERFAALQAAFEAQLADIAVYRVGEVEIQVVIVGVDREGKRVGLRTTVVQT